MKSETNEIINVILKESGFNGVCLVAENSEIVYANAVGMANFEHQVPNTLNTKFRIASITKQFTAVSILQLVENNLLSLDEKLSTFFPDYPAGDSITIHHLLTHTSGISNFDLESDFYPVFHSDDYRESLINLFKDIPLMFEPGTSFSYSVSGYLLLGYIVEYVTGLNYEDYLEKNIFSKIGMFSSGYDYYQNVVLNRANCYSKIGEDIQNAEFVDMRIAGGGGGLYSTILDLFIWNNALFNATVITEDSLNKILGDQFELSPNDSVGYGMFKGLVEIGGKKCDMRYHNGGGIGVRSFNSFFLNEKIQFVLISNVNDKKSFESAKNSILEIIL